MLSEKNDHENLYDAVADFEISSEKVQNLPRKVKNAEACVREA